MTVMGNRTRLKAVSIVVLITMVVSVFMTFSPNGIFADTEPVEAVDQVYQFKDLQAAGKLSGTAHMIDTDTDKELVFGTSGTAPNLNTTYGSATGGYNGTYYAMNAHNNRTFTVTANLEIPETAEYGLYFYIPHQNGMSGLDVTVTDGAGTEHKVENFSTKTDASFAGKWLEIGTYSFTQGTDAKVTFSSKDTSGGSFRMDALKLVKVGSSELEVSPSPEEVSPSPEMSPSPSPSPSSLPLPSDDSEALLPQVATDGKIYYKGNDHGAVTKTVNGSTSVAKSSTGFYNSVNGQGAITKYANLEAEQEPWILEDNTKNTVSVTFSIFVPQAGEYTLEFGQSFKFYTHEVSVNGGESFTVSNGEGDMWANTDASVWTNPNNWVTAGTVTLNAGINTITVNKGGRLFLDTIRLTQAGTAPSPSTSPDLPVKLYDDNDGKTKLTYHVPEGLEQSEVFQISWSGQSSKGSHGYAAKFDSSVTYTLDNPGIGLYKVSVNVPIVHSNNTDNMYVSVTDSLGNVQKEILDIRSTTNGEGTSATGVKNGDWVTVAENCTFYNVKEPTITFGIDSLGEQTGTSPIDGDPVYEHSGNYRFDAVRIERTGTLETYQPFALDTEITGAIKPNSVLTGNYVYTSEGPDKDQGATEIKWYTKATADGEYTLKKQGVYNEEGMLNYQLGENEWYVKFEVTPKDPSGTAGITASCERAIARPVVNNLNVTGRLRPGAELTATYEYEHPDDWQEVASTYTWYTRSSADDEWTAASTGTTTSAEGAAFTSQARYVKFEITPKCDISLPDFVEGETASYEFDRYYEEDLAPEATEVTLTGAPLRSGYLTASYKFNDANLDLEQSSSYRWLASSDPAADISQWREIASGTTTAQDTIQYQIPEDFPLGDYIRFEIIPKSDSGSAAAVGQAVLSDSIGPVTIGELIPSAKNVQMGGQVVNAENAEGLALNGTAEITYTYMDPAGTAEGETVYKWYVSDTSIGEYTEIPGATGKTYMPAAEYAGKFIKAGVLVKNANDIEADEEVFTVPYQVKYDLAFNEDFDYTAADGYDETFSQTWNSNSGYRVLGGYKQARVPENVHVADGKLVITTRKETLPQYTYAHDWTTGCVWTKEKYGPHGYYETRMKLAYASGLHQSFWAAGGTEKYTPTGLNHVELDFCEARWPRCVSTALHHISSDGSNRRVYKSARYYPLGKDPDGNTLTLEPPTLGDDFHTYSGLFLPNDPSGDWEDPVNSDTFQVFWDGVQYRSTKSMPYDNVSPVSIYVSNGVYGGTTFDGDPDPIYEETVLPNQFSADGATQEIDYVRFFELLDVADATLNNTIVNAEDLAANTKVGSGFMQCSDASALTNLGNAIAAAKVVADNDQATSDQNNEQIRLVTEAMEAVQEKISYIGEMEQNGVYDLTNVNAYVKATIPENVTTVTVTMPAETKKTITFISEACDGFNVTFPMGSQITGSFTLPRKSTFDMEGKETISSYTSFGLNVTNGLMKLSMPNITNYKLASIDSNGQASEVTATVSSNNDTAAAEAIGNASMVVYYGPRETVAWTSKALSVGFFKDSVTPSSSPTPSPTPSDNNNNNSSSNNNNNNNNSWTDGSGIIIPPNNNTNNGTDEKKFTDISGHWAEDDILYLAEKGLINGKTKDLFAPDDTMTRAEYAAIIRRALGLNPVLYHGGIGDVASNAWYANEVQAIIDSGIMSGDADGNFRPDDLISRQEMAKVIVNAYIYRTGNSDIEVSDLHFTDNESISAWAQEYVGKAVGLGILTGMDDGSFAPLSNMTRAQGAVTVVRVIR